MVRSQVVCVKICLGQSPQMWQKSYSCTILICIQHADCKPREWIIGEFSKEHIYSRDYDVISIVTRFGHQHVNQDIKLWPIKLLTYSDLCFNYFFQLFLLALLTVAAGKLKPQSLSLYNKLNLLVHFPGRSHVFLPLSFCYF